MADGSASVPGTPYVPFGMEILPYYSIFIVGVTANGNSCKALSRIIIYTTTTTTTTYV